MSSGSRLVVSTVISGQDRDLGARPLQGDDDLGRAVEDLLAVVQADECAPGPELAGQQPQRIAGRIDKHPDGCDHQLGELPGLRDGGQVDPPDTVGPPVGKLSRNLRRQPGLPTSARPGQRHQPIPHHLRPQRSQLHLPPDKAGEHHRQVVGNDIKRSQSVRLPTTAAFELEHPLSGA
jgi:hypothetical protein